MAVSPPPILTVEDYRNLPETGPRYQLIKGELFMSPAPTWYHQIISRNIQFALLKYLEKHPGGELLAAPFDVFLTNHDVYQPDLLFVTQSRLELIRENGVHGAPDLVVEILSPSSVQLDKNSKRRVYAQAGVGELWIVDPEDTKVQVYRLPLDANEPQVEFGKDGVLTTQTFPDFSLAVAEIFKR